MAIIEFGLILNYAASWMMAVALAQFYPNYRGWQRLSRSLAWPVTLYELISGRL